MEKRYPLPHIFCWSLRQLQNLFLGEKFHTLSHAKIMSSNQFSLAHRCLFIKWDILNSIPDYSTVLSPIPLSHWISRFISFLFQTNVHMILVETFNTSWSPKVGSNNLFQILWLSHLGQYKSYGPLPTCTRTCWVSGRRLHLTTWLHCYFNFLVPQVLSRHFPPTARSFATKWAQLTVPKAAIQRKRKTGENCYNLSCLWQLYYATWHSLKEN